MNNTFYSSLESNKKALIFVPHEDDEINICGGIIPILIDKKVQVKVVYSTNGDYVTRSQTRIKECINSLNILGVPSENIILMGYSDQHGEMDDHLYMTDENNIWKSKKGYTKTYHPFNKKEVAMKYENVHHDFNKKNFIRDLVFIIEDEKPDYIYCIDFDSHADHRALSLGLEEALGIVLNKCKNYTPIVYKSFAYPTCYFGYKDFDNINIKSTKFKTEEFSYSVLENPYYLYGQRVRFPLKKESRTKFLLGNKTFNALRCHKSQCIVGRAGQTINGDQIFWQRRTDNLLYNSNVTVSSGDKAKLFDFMLFKCSNILKGNTKKVYLESDSWIPDFNDKSPTIEIEFSDIKKLDELVLYHSISTDSIISEIEITGDNYKKTFKLKRTKNNISKINLSKLVSKKIIIKVINKTGDDAGFSEIEIFEHKKRLIEFIKLEIDGDFAYKYYYKNEEFKVYSYDGYESKYLNEDEFKIISNNIEISNNKLILKKKTNKLRIELINNSNIYDEIVIKKTSKLDIIVNRFLNNLNNIIIYCCYLKQRIIRKIKRLMKIN